MGKYHIEYLPIAYEDLEEIFSYIASDAPSAASDLLGEIDKSIQHLENFPSIGTTPKNRRLAGKGYKILIVNEYLVFYVVIGEIIEIRRILSGRRNYAKLL